MLIVSYILAITMTVTPSYHKDKHTGKIKLDLQSKTVKIKSLNIHVQRLISVPSFLDFKGIDLKIFQNIAPFKVSKSPRC